MGSDSPTRFKGPLGVRKRAAWAEPLPLEEVKVMGKALGCSINDVLLSMATGALRDYLADKGDPVDGVEIRAIVPGEPAPRRARPRTSATTSGWCSSTCPSASSIPSSASTRCAGACSP